MKKPMHYLVQAACILLIVLSSHTSYGLEGRVNARVRMHETPKLTGKFLLNVEQGTRVEIIDETGNWFKVKFKKGKFWQVGWIADEFIDLIEPLDDVVTEPSDKIIAPKTDLRVEDASAVAEVKPDPEELQVKGAQPVLPESSTQADATDVGDENLLPPPAMKADSDNIRETQRNADLPVQDATTVPTQAKTDLPAQEGTEVSTPEKTKVPVQASTDIADQEQEGRSKGEIKSPKTVAPVTPLLVDRNSPPLDSQPPITQTPPGTKQRLETSPLPINDTGSMLSRPAPRLPHTPTHFQSTIGRNEYLLLGVAVVSMVLAAVALLFSYKAYSLSQTILKFTLNKRRQKIIIGDEQYEKLEKGGAEEKQRLIQVDFRVNDSIYSGFIYQLSAYVASIYTSEPFVAGTNVQISYCDPEDDINIRKNGRIIGTHIQGIEVLFNG